MFSYDLRLALDSLRRNPGLSALMVLAIALGIAVCTMTFTVYHAMATNPIPEKSSQLYHVTLDTWGAERPYDDDNPDNPPTLLTYRDATYLHQAKGGPRTAIMYKSGALVIPAREGVKPYNARMRLTSHEFFSMFNVPFAFGQGWDEAADEGPLPVAVLSHETNEKIFGGENSVGQMLKLGSTEYRIVGVLKPWSPSPKFFDLNNGAFEDPEEVYVPFAWGPQLELPVYGNTNCWKAEASETYQDFLNSECVWLQFWAELPTTADRDRSTRSTPCG